MIVHMVAAVTIAKKGAVGRFSAATYAIPLAEIDSLGDLAKRYMREQSAALRPAAWCLWGVEPREFLELRPAFRGKLDARLELDHAIRRGEVNALVIRHPLDIGRSIRASLCLIRAWQRTGKLRELFCVDQGAWLIRGGELVRGGLLAGDDGGSAQRPTLVDSLELLARWEAETVSRQVRIGMALSHREPGRPRAQVDLEEIGERVAAGGSTRGIVRALQAKGSAGSPTTLRRRVRDLKGSAVG